MTEKDILYKGQSVHYSITGQGQPVMLVHGFGEDASVWEKQVAELKAQYQLILPHLPGSGKSVLANAAATPGASSANNPEWTMEYFAECLQAIIQEEKIDQFTLIGHSMGGYVTLAFAEKYADQLKGFGLFHSTAYADNEEKVAARRKGIAFVQQNGAKKFLEQSIPNLFAEATKEEHPELVQDALSRFTYFSGAAVIGYYEAMIQRPDRTAVLKSFPRPILFIIGQHDTAVLPDQTLQQSHLPAISYVRVFEESGHMGMWEQAEDANEALTGYLKLVHA